MNKLNVNRGINDVFYRYKMPKIEAKFVGKGKKTELVNIEEIGKALLRPSIFIVKYFGYKLGTGICGKDRLQLNGLHSSDTLQNFLDGFIRKFVLCAICDNPETELTVKRASVVKSCKACGNVEMLKADRLTHFIANDSTCANMPTRKRKEKSSSDPLRCGSKDNSNEKIVTEANTLDWALPLTDEAIRQRRNELCLSVRKLVLKDL